MRCLERETFAEGARSKGRQALEALGLGVMKPGERADSFRHFNTRMVKRWRKGENDPLSRAAAYKRTQRDVERNYYRGPGASVVDSKRHGWQERLRATFGSVADEPEVKTVNLK